MKTLREIMGLRDSIGDIRLGDTVRIKASGHIGKVDAIGKHGLLAIQGCWGVYSPAEVEKVDKKQRLKAAITPASLYHRCSGVSRKDDSMKNCAICQRKLSDPESVKRGIGPVCYGKVKAELEEKKEEQQEQFVPFEGDIICKRTNSGPQVNIPHRIVKHSPAGLEWGYGGSGPADLALNALAMYIGREKAEENGLYQEFKRDFIAPMSFRGGTIRREDVAVWLAAKGIEMPGARELILA